MESYYWHLCIFVKGDDDAFLTKMALFKKERERYSWTMNMGAHAVIRLLVEKESTGQILLYKNFKKTKQKNKTTTTKKQTNNKQTKQNKTMQLLHCYWQSGLLQSSTDM